MNHGNSFIIGYAPFGLDDQVARSDGAIISRSEFLPASVLLPGSPYGPILTGDRARAARTHSGLPWPPEAWIKKGEHLRRAPVSLVWRALVEARDNQARWDIGGGVSFPLGKILAAHIADLFPLSKADEPRSLTIPIPNDLDEYGQESLLSEMHRVLQEREVNGEVRLLWRPVAAALTWLNAAGDDMKGSTVKANPNDFILVLYLGPDAIECVPFQLRIRRHEKTDYIVPRRDRPTDISLLAGYDWPGGMIEQLPQVREGGDGTLWQAFTSFPESWRILAGKDLQHDELPRVWGGDGNYGLWHPDEQKIKGVLNQTPCGPSKQVQSILKSSCALHGSRLSDLTWPKRLTALVKETVHKQAEGRLVGMIVCGALAPPSPPDWLTDCFPALVSRGMNPSGPWDNRIPNRLWMSPGNEAIAQGAALFNIRLINGEPTYLDTLPQYFLLAKREGRYTASPLVDAQEVDGGDYYQNNIIQRYMIEKNKPGLDIIIARGGVHEELLESSGGINALDHEVGREVEGLSLTGASLVRHLVRTADNHEKALDRIKKNSRNIRERIPGKAYLYGNAYANLWHGKQKRTDKKQLSLFPTNSTQLKAAAETPFRKLTFPFPILSPKEMPVDIHVRIRPASGMANMEVIPQDTTFLHGRKVFVDYRTMRPCPQEELRTDVRGWPPLEELTPHPDPTVWNLAKTLMKQFEQTPSRMDSFNQLLQGMYDLIKSPKLYFFPVGGIQIFLPMLSQNGLAGSQEGLNIIARFREILPAHTTDINRWSAGQRPGQVGWLITRASWLYGASPTNVITRINKEITESMVSTLIIEAGSRSLKDTGHLADLFSCIAKQVQNNGRLVTTNTRACRNILTLRHNGQDALNEKTAPILLKAVLKEIDGCAVKNNYQITFFASIKLLLYLLRYRKRNSQFLQADSKETEKIKDDLRGYLARMEKRMPRARFIKAKDIILGTIDYLNYIGKIDFLNILTEYSG